MSDSDRGGDGKAGLTPTWPIIVASLATLIIAIVLFIWLQPRQPDNAVQQRVEAQSRNYHPGGPQCDPARLDDLTGADAASERDRCNAAAAQHERQQQDLLQQRRMASAAETMNHLTFKQAQAFALQTSIVLLAFFAACAAAWYAKRAADEAKRGADTADDELKHAQRVSDIELRPWVTGRVEARRVGKLGVAATFEYDLICTNFGKTVAKDFQMFCRLDFVAPNQTSYQVAQLRWESWEPPEPGSRSVIMPGEDFIFHGWASHRIETIPVIGATEEGTRIKPVVIFSLLYKTDGEPDWHRTDRIYNIGTKGDENYFEWINLEALPLSEEEVIARTHSGNMAD